MTREEVLALLSQGDYVSGQKMSQQLGVSRAAVWKAIDRLRAEGYTIESATNRGYRLTGAPNRLSLAGLCSGRWGRIRGLIGLRCWTRWIPPIPMPRPRPPRARPTAR